MAQTGSGITRYKQTIKRAQKQLAETYKALGMLAHRQLKGETLGDEGLHRLSTEVDRLLAEIKESQEAIERLKLERQVTRGPLVCPACGLRAPGIRFCPSCGINMTIRLKAEASEIECPSCGQMITADSVFCGVCGANTELPVPEDEQPEEPAVSTVTTKNWSPAGTAVQDNGVEQLQSNERDAEQDKGNTPVVPASPEQAQRVSEGEESPDCLLEKCPNCGDALEPGAVFCVSCGSGTGRATLASSPPPSTPKTKCNYCGELAEIGTQFCLNCGQSLHTEWK